ncbi:MAG TPA: type II toxin-antitoxin system VapC family toxin [Gammaproteobacteria bacterium]|nr:type II toxin-antitoxin system VapC family toxin [Gammaproteobacteria bacterium]
MKILLDTHIFLWCTRDDKELSKKARSIICEATEVYVSSATIWEAVIKVNLGKLKVNIEELVDAITISGFTELPMSAKHAATVLQLHNLHCDPFDRILLAQAMSEPLKFVTADSLLKNYSDLVEIV